MSSNIAILVDSSSDLTVEHANRYDLHVLLLSVEFGGQDWVDHLELTAEDMFTALQANPGIQPPNIKVPRFEQYLTTVERLLQRHDQVLALHTSPLIGKVYAMAFRASEALPGKLTVINSGSTSAGCALQAIRARQLLDEGRKLPEVIELLAANRRRQDTQICVTTLDGFRRTGLIGAARAFVGEMRGVKPIIGVRGGRLEIITHKQGSEAAQSQMIEDFRSAAMRLESARTILAFNGDPGKLDPLRAAAQEMDVEVVLEVQLGAVLSSITGPDAYGFSLEPS